MFISKDSYNKLVNHNEKLTKEVYELERQIKYLTETNHEYFMGSVKWKNQYIKMRQLFDGREIESPIVAQRNAEIDALKHMLERVEAEQEDYKTAIRALNKENDKLKEVVDGGRETGTAELLMKRDSVIEENERLRQTLNNFMGSYTKVVQQREDYSAQLRNLQKENDELSEQLSTYQRKAEAYRDAKHAAS